MVLIYNIEMTTPKKIIIKDLELADEEIARLRKENKELKEEVKKRKMVADENWTGYDMLEEENKKLKEYNKTQSEVINNVFIPQKERLEEENKELKKKVETLEMWLDNKEKLNEEYRKKIDKLRTDNIYEEWLYD